MGIDLPIRCRLTGSVRRIRLPILLVPRLSLFLRRQRDPQVSTHRIYCGDLLEFPKYGSILIRTRENDTQSNPGTENNHDFAERSQAGETEGPRMAHRCPDRQVSSDNLGRSVFSFYCRLLYPSVCYHCIPCATRRRSQAAPCSPGPCPENGAKLVPGRPQAKT